MQERIKDKKVRSVVYNIVASVKDGNLRKLIKLV